MPYSDPVVQKEYFAEYYQQNRERKLAQATASYERNRDKILSYHQRQRLNTLSHYGGKCACCGEEHANFLSMDHINGGGTEHRKQLGRSGSRFYRWLVENDYPDGYQVLCYNCNMAKGFYGECPHFSLMREVGGLA